MCDYSDHKIDVFNLVQSINAISLPLIVAVESTNKATLTLLGTRTLSRTSSLPTTVPILLISLSLPLPSSPKPSKRLPYHKMDGER